ncbi:MAG: hypothetical protein K2Q25_13590 [Mycobacteriaceae bacterium]|nr:hypothetical protein [Mycobacteriaceae bacterium]
MANAAITKEARRVARERRQHQHLQDGLTLRAMRERGETLREIARMAGVAEKTVRELIKNTDATSSGSQQKHPATHSDVNHGQPATRNNIVANVVL